MRRTKPAVLPSKSKTLKRLGAASATILTLIAVVVWFAWPRGKTLTDFLLEAGYLEIVLPSKFYGPGTINTVEFRRDGKVELHPTCEMASGLLVDKVLESQTVDRGLAQLLKKSVDISGQIKDIFTSQAAINQTKSISLRFENAHILLMTDEALISVRKALLKNSCEEAVFINISNGSIVCQTREVLEADVIYEVRYKENVSVGERARFDAEAAAKLNLAPSQDSTNRISGRQLFFGIKLAPEAIILNTPDAKPMRCSTKN